MRNAFPFVTASAAWAAVMSFAAAAAAAPPAPATDAKEIASLIARLGDPEFDVREAASRRLVQIGGAALAALRAAESSPDVEVRSRAAAAVRRIELDALAPSRTDPPGRPLALRLVLGKKLYELDRGGLSAADYRRRLAELAAEEQDRGRAGRYVSPARGPRLPRPPALEAHLELVNVGDRSLELLVHRSVLQQLRITVEGPGVVKDLPCINLRPEMVDENSDVPVVLEPRGRVVLPLPELACGLTDLPRTVIAKGVEICFDRPNHHQMNTYWTEPGEHRLNASVEVREPGAPGAPARVLRVFAPPVTVKVVMKK